MSLFPYSSVGGNQRLRSLASRLTSFLVFDDFQILYSLYQSLNESSPDIELDNQEINVQPARNFRYELINKTFFKTFSLLWAKMDSV